MSTSYFSKFPIILDYELNGKFYDAIDITRRTKIINEARQNQSAYFDYVVKDGETPIILADRLYDDQNLYWVIMMFNELYDINENWPLTQQELERFILRNYNDPQGIHHYQSISTGSIVNSDHPEYDRVAITNYQYEYDRNELKRNIKLPLDRFVQDIVSEHRRLIEL